MPHSVPLRTAATTAGLIGGLAWIVDVAVITARNASFGVLDSILFLAGLAALVAMAGLVGALVGRRSPGLRRALVGVGVAIAVIASFTVLSLAADGISHALYTGTNRGLHKECGISSMGVAALILAAALQRARLARPELARARAVPSARHPR